MSGISEADHQVDKFSVELAQSAGMNGWTLIRHLAGHSDRTFELRNGNSAIPFAVHVSLSGNGFWGLTADKAAALVAENREHLVLLRDGGSGYFIPNAIVKRLMPKFSIASETGAVKINENKVRAQARFQCAEDLFELLQARGQPTRT